MKRKLVITHEFGDYRPGQEVTDAEAISKIETDHPDKAVPVLYDDRPAAVPALDDPAPPAAKK